ncbi:MAG: hypothetical protein M0C28_18760 [Candidatus Moduliflexus flocculans]|nr:hypothetical protein [Candidatus Moduliflexus flocculans]
MRSSISIEATCKHQKHYSPHTDDRVSGRFGDAFGFLENEDLGTLGSVTDRTAQFYIAHLHDTYTPGSIRRKISSVADAVPTSVRRRGGPAMNPFAGAALPKAAKTLPKFAYEDEIGGFLDGIDGTTLKGRRDAAMFETALRLGIRVGELVGLKIRSMSTWTKQRPCSSTERVARNAIVFRCTTRSLGNS